MAGDWIKIEHALPGKPEVMELARILAIDEMAVVGHLVCFWSWVDQNLSPDCPATNGTKKGLDRVACRDGFVDAMVQVGWLTFDGQKVQIPNYDHHLSQSAKKRGLESRKKNRQRISSRKCPATTGTSSGQKEGQEKRREESIYIEPPCEVVIPKKMQTEKVQEYFRTWMAHLELQYPEKVPMQNSPQLEMFWAEAARMGPDRFCESVQYSTANNWATLHERHVKENGKGKAAASYPDDLLKICTVCKQHPQEPAKRREILGPKLHEISRRLDVQTILSSIGDDWKMKSLNQFFGQHLKDLECKTT